MILLKTGLLLVRKGRGNLCAREREGRAQGALRFTKQKEKNRKEKKKLSAECNFKDALFNYLINLLTLCKAMLCDGVMNLSTEKWNNLASVIHERFEYYL